MHKTITRREEVLEKLLIAAIELAIVRWDLQTKDGKDIDEEQGRTIAQDIAWACRMCPIDEWTEAL